MERKETPVDALETKNASTPAQTCENSREEQASQQLPGYSSDLDTPRARFAHKRTRERHDLLDENDALERENDHLRRKLAKKERLVAAYRDLVDATEENLILAETRLETATIENARLADENNILATAVITMIRNFKKTFGG